MRRYQVRPYGHSISGSRTLSLLMTLAAIWMLYSWVRQPATWNWLAEAGETDDIGPSAREPRVQVPGGPGAAAATEAAPKDAAKDGKSGPADSKAKDAAEQQVKEVVVPGPNDTDPEAMKDFKSKLELLTDRAPLRGREMSLYWKLMEWCRTEPIKSLEARSDATTSFSQIWEQPEHYRAKLIRLRMHVRRVLKYEAPENPLGMKTAYEIWGWTEDSKSYPYVIVVPELPPGLRVGPDVRGEIVFVGYFFKIISYTAFDVPRGAPMLIGRVRHAATAVAGEPLNSPSSLMMIATMAVATICAGIAIRFLLMMWNRRPATMLPATLDGTDTFSMVSLDRQLPVTPDGFSSESDWPESSGSGWAPEQ